MSSRIIKIDKIVFTLYIILTVVGIVTLLLQTKAANLIELKKQGLFFAPVSILFTFAFVSKGSVETFRKHEAIHYAISTLLLILVFLLGKEAYGAKRSINLFHFTFQPSYYTRIIMISSLAIYIAKYRDLLTSNKIYEFIKQSKSFFIFAIISYILILKEPHLSILLITSLSLFLMLVLAGLNNKIIAVILAISIVAITGIFVFGHGYRFTRLKVYSKYSLLNPYRNEVVVTPDQERQIEESLGALSAGGIWGTKSDFGSSALDFVPEAKTDYIFSFIGEEFGFVRSSLLLLVFFGLFFRLFYLSAKVKDNYRRYLALGLSLNFITTVVVNTGVSISTLPSTGVSLPFISYGGSAFLMDSFSLAIILNIVAREGATS